MEKPDHDSGSNRNHSDTVEAKMDSPNESEKKQSRSHPQTPPSGLTEATPSQKPPFNRNQESESNDDDTPSKQRRCNCKASRCLKLYCECFASGLYCNGCKCLNCHNTLEKENARQEAIKAALERNPDAFKAKIAGSSPHGLNDLQEHVSQLVILGKHNKGCHCKKSGCLKKYCECYQANVRCSESCRCQDCKNFEGSEEIQQTTNAAAKHAIDMSCHLHPSESRKRKIKAASHSVAARVSSAVPHLVQNQTVNYVVRSGDTSLFTVPNNQAISGSTTSTYRSSLSNTIQLRYAKELCSLLVSKSVEVANKFSANKRRKNEKDSPLDPAQRDASVINESPDCVLDAGRMDEKPVSPATRALMCDDEHVTILEKEASAPVRTSQEKEEDSDTSSEVYSEQEKQILSCFRDYLLQILNRRLINGRYIQKANTDPSRKEPEDKEQNNRDSSLGA